MENDDTRPPDPPVMAPPSEMGDLVPERSKWPTVIGVIGILVASFGLFGGCCGVLSPFLMNFSRSMASSGGGMSQEQIDTMMASQPPMLWIIPASLVGMALATLLLIGCIGLARRRAGGVTLCKVWAWIIIPWTLISLVVAAYFQFQVPADAQQMGLGFQMGVGIQYFFLAAGACFALTTGVGFPMFMLIWFARPSVKDDVDAWAAESRAMI